MSNRYDDRKVFKNNNEMYESLFDARDVKFIRHFDTPRIRQPTIRQRQQLNSITHIWKTGDRFYKVAAQYYQSPRYWWVIALYNKRPTEADLKPGNVIYVPLPLETVLGFYLR